MVRPESQQVSLASSTICNQNAAEALVEVPTSKAESRALRLSSPLGTSPGLTPCPHLRRDWAHPCHICIGTGLTPGQI